MTMMPEPPHGYIGETPCLRPWIPCLACAEMIPPDDKDWTWVLDRRCPECQFHAGAVDVRDIPELVRANAAEWQDVLATA